MTAAVETLIDLLRRGIRIAEDQGELVVRGERSKLTPELLAELKARKYELLSVLQDRPRLCREIWTVTAGEVAAKWNRLFAGTNNPPWLDVEEDFSLQEQIRSAIRQGDITSTIRLADKWKAEWEKLLENT